MKVAIFDTVKIFYQSEIKEILPVTGIVRRNPRWSAIRKCEHWAVY